MFFPKLDFTICQGTKDLKRFIELGVNKDRVIKDYSFKFDSLSIPNERDNFENKGKKLIICASTHDPEEKILVKAFSMLNNENAILVLVPRHPERASKIIKDIKKLGINPSLFSQNNLKIDLSNKINLIDEIGYLESLFSQANIAFIGGSLIPRGGQNFLEALKFSLPISSGESFYNFQEIAEDLIEMDILKVGNSAEKLKLIWEEQLNSVPNQVYEKTDDYLKQRMGASQRAFKHLSL